MLVGEKVFKISYLNAMDNVSNLRRTGVPRWTSYEDLHFKLLISCQRSAEPRLAGILLCAPCMSSSAPAESY